MEPRQRAGVRVLGKGPGGWARKALGPGSERGSSTHSAAVPECVCQESLCRGVGCAGP